MVGIIGVGTILFSGAEALDGVGTILGDGTVGTTGAGEAASDGEVALDGTTGAGVEALDGEVMVMPGALHMDIMVVTQEEILEDRTLPTIIQDEDTITGTMLIETVLQLL